MLNIESCWICTCTRIILRVLVDVAGNNRWSMYLQSCFFLVYDYYIQHVLANTWCVMMFQPQNQIYYVSIEKRYPRRFFNFTLSSIRRMARDIDAKSLPSKAVFTSVLKLCSNTFLNIKPLKSLDSYISCSINIVWGPHLRFYAHLERDDHY